MGIHFHKVNHGRPKNTSGSDDKAASFGTWIKKNDIVLISRHRFIETKNNMRGRKMSKKKCVRPKDRESD